MEDRLDKIENESLEWKKVLSDFYTPFEKSVEQAKSEMKNIKRQEIPTDIVCEKCSEPMVIKWGRNGSFLACKGYPECRNTMEFKKDEDGKVIPVEIEEEQMGICDKCESPMLIKNGRYGRFLACSKYPECKTTKPIPTGVSCPVKECGGGIVEKTTRRKKIFYGCSNYPKCNFAVWNKPVEAICPLCEAPILLEKEQRDGKLMMCYKKSCGYKEKIEK